MSDLLHRTLGEQVSIQTVLAPNIWRVFVDPNQLEVGLLNLAVNARDAMPQGGQLIIETANVFLDESYAAAQVEVIPGQYVVVSVTDSGIGMPREVLARAFEPFYTTKDIGHGTGLGLSQVYGFVKQSGGNVKIYSEEGHGTTVKIYLPRLHSNEKVDEESLEQRPGRVSVGQKILVVEDEDDVRAFTTEILRELGYEVLEAANGAAALHTLRREADIVLLFTDVGLPGGMNGRHLADVARKLRADLKVLFTTGYARNAIVHDGRVDPGVALIPKPFTYAGLAAKIEEVLDTDANKTALIVADEPLIQMLAVEYLGDLGYRTETAGSATEAMNKIRLLNGRIGLAVIDIGLPDKKGDVLIREIRALFPNLLIVIASGQSDARLSGELENDCAIALLRKPYTQGDITKVIDALMRRQGLAG